MKYTVEGFLQCELIALDLDLSDALILRWFIDFAGTGCMRQFIYNHRVYYFVKYSGIIADLPVLGISSTKGIGKRFDKYVEKGLLLKETRRKGAGTLLFFAPTRNLLELQYNSQCNPMKGTSVPFEDMKGTGVPISSMKGTPVAFRKEPPFPSERNSGSPALNNSSTRNSSTTDSLATETSNSPGDKNSAAVLKNEFGKKISVEVFSPDFWEKTATFLTAQNLTAESIPRYVDFLFDYAKKNNPRNLPHYLYKTAATSYMVAEFQNNQSTVQSRQSQESIPKKWHCICGAVVREGNCPECGLARRELGDEMAILRAKERYRTLGALSKKTEPG